MWRMVVWCLAFMLAARASAGELGAVAPAAGAPAQIVKAEFRANASVEQYVLYLSAPVEAHAFTLDRPDRVVINISNAQPSGDVAFAQGVEHVRAIRKVRAGWFNPATYRIVLETADMALRPTIFTLAADRASPHPRLVVEWPAPAAPAVADSAQARVSPASREKKSSAPKARQGPPNISASEPAAPHVSPPVQKLKEPAQEPAAKTVKDANGKLVQDLPLIVIDPGHGGQDPGALGGGGAQEKDLTLAYGLALREVLASTGRYRVAMTRADDRFILLRERVAIARRAGAALFVSLHADSAPESRGARGLSVYTVSETASDKEAEALAARENKADIIAGMDLSGEAADVADILVDLARRETKNKSAQFAESVVSGMQAGRVALLPNTHRFAGFAVLKAPDIPSILVEIGFLSNSTEERALNTAAHREKVVQGIVRGIDRYFANRKKGI